MDLSGQPFKIRMYLEEADRYEMFKIRLGPSSIPGAGLGVFAVDRIPKNARCLYKGVKKSTDKGNGYYSWVIYEYDENTGKMINLKELYVIDASDIKRSNWTRFVNCGLRRRDNNVDCEQSFDKIYYFTKKKILPGQEMFIDYGKAYRKENLGMQGKY
jgi:hypothetical protein